MNLEMIVIALILLVTAGFFWSFERSRPGAEDLVLMSQLCALAIGVRAVFSFVPYFNPVMAVIALSGLMLGVNRGFLTGAMTAVLSNFIFGQGPWTFFQMAGWGFLGAMFGLWGRIGLVRRSEWSVKDYVAGCVSAFVLIVGVMGPITDLSSFFMMGEKNPAVLKAVILMGLPMNVTLAVSTVVALAAVGRPFIFVMKRVEEKSRREG